MKYIIAILMALGALQSAAAEPKELMQEMAARMCSIQSQALYEGTLYNEDGKQTLVSLARAKKSLELTPASDFLWEAILFKLVVDTKPFDDPEMMAIATTQSCDQIKEFWD